MGLFDRFKKTESDKVREDMVKEAETNRTMDALNFTDELEMNRLREEERQRRVRQMKIERGENPYEEEEELPYEEKDALSPNDFEEEAEKIVEEMARPKNAEEKAIERMNRF